MRAMLILCCVVIAIVVATSTSRSDAPATDSSAATPTDEPITGAPITPAPGSESPMRDPFTPYEIGGPEAAWSYESLTAEEKAVADHGRDVKKENWDATHDAYKQAVMARAAQAAADAAALQLGVGALATTGVVP